VGNEGGHLKGTNTWPAKGLSWYGVSRRLRADVTRGAQFSGGKGGQGDTLKGCFLVVIEAPEKAGDGIAGLCADEHRLYVSCPGADEIAEDPRLHLWSAGAWVRGIQGKRFLFVNDMYSEALQAYRFDPAKSGEIAVPSVFFANSHIKKQDPPWPPGQPEKGEWIWRDTNGNGAFDWPEYLSNGGKDAPPLWGWWVDSAGNVWQATQNAGIRKFACQGLDAQGNPIYDFASLATMPMPAPFTRLERIYYFPATDTMYLAGYTADRPHHDGLWKVMGRVICRHDHWSKGQSSPRWQIAPDYTVDGS
jgi:hypothetical protein